MNVTTQTYLGMAIPALTFAVLALITLPIAAEPKVDNGRCHYPVSSGKEYKFTCKGGVMEDPDTGIPVAAFAITEFERNPYNVAPETDSLLGNQSDQLCLMVNDDGQAAETEVFQVYVKTTCPDGLEGEALNGARCSVRYEVRCGRFVPRPY